MEQPRLEEIVTICDICIYMSLSLYSKKNGRISQIDPDINSGLEEQYNTISFLLKWCVSNVWHKGLYVNQIYFDNILIP
jgi:hypothetical protein